MFIELDVHCCWVRQVVWAILSQFPLGFFRKWAGCSRHHAPGAGPGRQGREVHPQRSFSLHTHFGPHRSERSEPGSIRQGLRSCSPWQPVTPTSPAPGRTETGVPSPSGRWRGAGSGTVASIRAKWNAFSSPALQQPVLAHMGEGEEKRTQFKTAPRPSILGLDVGCTRIPLKLFLTCSLLNLFKKGAPVKTGA